jgi:hypothetical protein
MSPIMNNWGARLEPKSGGAGEEVEEDWEGQGGWCRRKKKGVVVFFFKFVSRAELNTETKL